MPDKLTDSEIVKDLNEAEDLENVLLYCKNPNKEVMTPIKITDIRDLINRLQAENERLKDYVDTVEKEVDWYRDELRHSDKKVENKVYKKVFEKLNDKSIRSKAKVKGCGFLYVSVVTLHDINALKKELVGDDK